MKGQKFSCWSFDVDWNLDEWFNLFVSASLLIGQDHL